MGRVVVVGSINADLVAHAPHLPAPGETVAGDGFARHPGGKGANQAIAAARAGVPTEMVGRVGDDPFGAELRAFLAAQGVDVAHVATTPSPTGVALIVVDADGENSIVVVGGANAEVCEGDASGVSPGPGDVVVSQFETPVATTLAVFTAATAAGARTLLNPAPAAPVPDELLAVTDVLVVNEVELGQVAGTDLGATPGPDEVVAAARVVRHGHGEVAVVATLGAHGIVAVAEGEPIVRAAHPAAAVVDTTGAGDCFVGWVAAGLARGDALDAALDDALVAAALCVARPGAGSSMPTRAEVVAARERSR